MADDWPRGFDAQRGCNALSCRCPFPHRYLERTVLRSRIHPFQSIQALPHIGFRVNFLYSFDLKSQLSSVSDASDRSLSIDPPLRYTTQMHLPRHYHTHVPRWHGSGYPFRRHGVQVAGGVGILRAEDARHFLHWTPDS